MLRLLLAFAFVFFVIAAIMAGPNSPGPNSGPWYSRLVAAGLACWVLFYLLGAFEVKF